MSRRGYDVHEGVREGTVTEQVATAVMSLRMAVKPVLENDRREGGLGGLGHPQGLAGDEVQWVAKEAPWGGGRPTEGGPPGMRPESTLHLAQGLAVSRTGRRSQPGDILEGSLQALGCGRQWAGGCSDSNRHGEAQGEPPEECQGGGIQVAGARCLGDSRRLRDHLPRGDPARGEPARGGLSGGGRRLVRKRGAAWEGPLAQKNT